MIQRGKQQRRVAQDDRVIVQQADLSEGIRRIDRPAPTLRL
jgi:hypothetical protein